MFKVRDVIHYTEMCNAEGTLQRGMNFRVRNGYSIVLMSVRKNAPYADRVEDEGKILIYEGHDVQKNFTTEPPKTIDQPLHTPKGNSTQNGLFYNAAMEHKRGGKDAELVKVYEKIMDGIWVYNGIFKLIDAWVEDTGKRKVFKFKLQITNSENIEAKLPERNIEHNRMIPSDVKIEVWKRDKGKCRKCGSTVNLHFDRILPFSKGGASITAQNIQILCAKHNLEKRDRIV